MHLLMGSGARSVVRIVFTGDLDEARAGEVRDVIVEKMFISAPARIELDLGQVGTVASSAFGPLVACHQLATIAGSRLMIVGASPAVRRFIWACGLSGLFSPEDGHGGDIGGHP
ncbi:STAS domain-containing protein [Couchioplanes azureus]|uniref:STAS domain-containing protein n=1 Tax=Couchioplanes caeruleus TaxID=56438 RepID=UPI001670DFF6|nr:STAS domain-containing protein [Couchioplanes caeruleus]GGQ85612.1 hypothetical protein GCM10010166_64950 [Couchioplanes caeruleus subsp. azureus]